MIVVHTNKFDEFIAGFYSKELNTFFVNNAAKTAKLILLIH